MGVYVFRSKCGRYIKVGHFAGADAWGRVAFRGFHSCAHPRELDRALDATDVELAAWYPDLGTRDEHAVHRIANDFAGVGRWPPCVGEWHDARACEVVLAELQRRSKCEQSMHDSCDLDAVRRAGPRRVRKAGPSNSNSSPNTSHPRNCRGKKKKDRRSRAARGNANGNDNVSNSKALPQYAFLNDSESEHEGPRGLAD